MSVPESIAWLETSRDSNSPSMAQVYSTTILGELTRLSEALHVAAEELEHRERLRAEAVAAHRSLENTFYALEERTKVGREEWDFARTDMETRMTKLTDKLNAAEGVLKDAHWALLHQPELTREEIAMAITSVVTPYPEGAKA